MKSFFNRILTLLCCLTSVNAATNIMNVVSSNTFNTYVDVRLRKPTNSPAAYQLIGIDSSGTNGEYKNIFVQNGTNLFVGHLFIDSGTAISPGLAGTFSQSSGISWINSTNFILSAEGTEVARGTKTNLLVTNLTVINFNVPSTLNATTLQIGGTNISGPVVSGTYTPSLTAVANLDSIIPNGTFQYTRIGNIVSVTGYVAVDATAAGYLDTSFTVSLPVARANFADYTSGAGVFTVYNNGASAVSASGTVLSNFGAQTMLVEFPSPYTVSVAGTITFSYKLN